MKYIFDSEPLSQNIYTRHSQLTERINKLRDIWQNQKFSPEITYSFVDLRLSLDHWKKVLKFTEIDIKELEQNSIFFRELDVIETPL